MKSSPEFPIIEVLENKEDGTHCNIVLANDSGFNVVFIDTDSSEMIGARCNILDYLNAIKIAKTYLNK